MDIIALSQKLTNLIALGSRQTGKMQALLGGGRVNNPLYSPDAVDKKGFHRIGEGKEQSVWISRIISPQRTVHGASVRSMKGKIERGTMKGSLPTVQKVGKLFVAHDGNHRIAAALKAGKRVVRAAVQ